MGEYRRYATYVAQTTGSQKLLRSIEWPFAWAREQCFRVSSIRITGKEIFRTVTHSTKLSGVIWNTV